MQALRCDVDYARPGQPLNIRRHGLSQGGIDDQPLTPKDVEPYTMHLLTAEW